MAKNRNLEQFKEYELFPSLYDRLDTAFPEMEFKRKGNRWESSHHLNGDKDSSNKVATYVYENSKFCIVDLTSDRRPNLINFYMERYNKDFATALAELSQLCGLTPPTPENSEEWQKRQEQQTNREKANRTFVTALWSGTAEANKVLEYLHSRKWTDEEIKIAELGLITTEIRNSLADGDSYKGVVKEKDTDRIIGGVGTTHLLTIPYRNGSRLFGFKFREVGASTGTKYLNSYGLTKGKGLFGIGIGVKDATIVEGELDALHAQVRGASYVVATTGGAATKEQVEDAKRRGVNRFTLLFDNDEKGKEFTLTTATIAENLGVETYVAELPQGFKDTDEYLGTHSIEEFNAITASAIPSYSYKFERVVDKYNALYQAQENNLWFKDREDFLREVAAIVNAPTMKPYNREVIYAQMEQVKKDLLVGMDGYREYIDKEYYRKQAKERTEEVTKASTEINAALTKGDTDGAIRLMRETANKVGAEDKSTEFARVFAPMAPNDLSVFLSEVPDGIPTGFKFKEPHNTQEEELTLNSGLTFICGYRGHCKTTFLNNIALNEAKRNVALGNGKSVLYFSYEVDKRRLIADLLNTFVNDPDLSRNPSNTILSYFKAKTAEDKRKYFASSGTINGTNHYDNFVREYNKFAKNYIQSGALTIVDESYKVGKLLDAIKFYISTCNASMVCIDYAQLIYSEDYSRQRTEEIKQVVNDIKDFANKEGIPFVMAAQFNREVDSPVSVDTKNIGEGGDFERIADTCIGLFNLKELHPLPKNRDEEKETKKLLSDLGVCTYADNESLKPIYGKLFVKLMKRRYGYFPLSIVLPWTGATKYIEPNNPEALDTTAKQEELDLYTQSDEPAPF